MPAAGTEEKRSTLINISMRKKKKKKASKKKMFKKKTGTKMPETLKYTVGF